MSDSEPEITHTLLLSNDLARPVTVILEPWGEATRIEPNAECQVLVKNQNGGFLSISVYEGGIMVFAGVDAHLEFTEGAR